MKIRLAIWLIYFSYMPLVLSMQSKQYEEILQAYSIDLITELHETKMLIEINTESPLQKIKVKSKGCDGKYYTKISANFRHKKDYDEFVKDFYSNSIKLNNNDEGLMVSYVGVYYHFEWSKFRNSTFLTSLQQKFKLHDAVVYNALDVVNNYANNIKYDKYFLFWLFQNYLKNNTAQESDKLAYAMVKIKNILDKEYLENRKQIYYEILLYGLEKQMGSKKYLSGSLLNFKS